MVNRPDYVVFVPRQPRDPKLRDPKKPGDTYNDHFQVIEDEKRGLLYAFWTQASREGAIDQHIAFSKSADRGRSWTAPVILAGSPNKSNPGLLASWQQPMLSKTGRLYCLWNLSITNSKVQSFGACWGAYSDDAGETWSRPQSTPLKQMAYDAIAGTPDWINWQRPLRLGQDGRFLVGCSRTGKAPWDRAWGTRTEFWQYENIDDNPEIPDIRISMFATNRMALTTVEAEKIPGTFKDAQPAIEEAAIAKLPDGRLFAVMRSSVGSPVWSQSRDAGRTWSAPKLLCDRDGGKLFLHPRSPVPFYDWKSPEAGSGTYFALIHNAFDFNGKTAYQRRGPLYLIAGTFMPTAEQPVWFKEPKLFAPREDGNSFYTSSLVLDGKGVLWCNDKKFYLCGRVIGPEWFDRLDLKERNNRYEEKTANGIPRCLRVRGFCRARVGRTSQDACVVSL